MTVILFWNTNGKDFAGDIGEMCRRHHVDLLVLAETKTDPGALLGSINSHGEFRYQEYTKTNEYIRFISKLPNSSVIIIEDYGRFSTVHIRPPIGKELLVTGAHLTSKLHYGPADQEHQAQRLSESIKSCEDRIKLKNSVLIGDLNMNPFEPGMVSARGLNGVADKAVASKVNRILQGEEWPFFYNPMWSLMGDDSRGPPGTYYRQSANVINYFWNMFDQVLLRPSLIEDFKPENLHILTNTGLRNLLKDGKVDVSISDHLPILIEI